MQSLSLILNAGNALHRILICNVLIICVLPQVPQCPLESFSRVSCRKTRNLVVVRWSCLERCSCLNGKNQNSRAASSSRSATIVMSAHVPLWKSKLGNEYIKADIERQHEQTIKELRQLRRLDGNSACADCGQVGTVWSSVNLGVFLCMRCGSLHRALGTHISKPKGLTGTYMWGPDEIANMKQVGNKRANRIYGGIDERPAEDAPDAEWLQYIRQKYEEQKFVPRQKASANAKNDLSSKSSTASVPTATLIDLDGVFNKKDSDDFFAKFGL